MHIHATQGESEPSEENKHVIEEERLAFIIHEIDQACSVVPVSAYLLTSSQQVHTHARISLYTYILRYSEARKYLLQAITAGIHAQINIWYAIMCAYVCIYILHTSYVCVCV